MVQETAATVCPATAAAEVATTMAAMVKAAAPKTTTAAVVMATAVVAMVHAHELRVAGGGARGRPTPMVPAVARAADGVQDGLTNARNMREVVAPKREEKG